MEVGILTPFLQHPLSHSLADEGEVSPSASSVFCLKSSVTTEKLGFCPRHCSLAVFVSYHCCNQLPQTEWGTTLEMYSLSVLDTGSSKPMSEGPPMLALKALGKIPSWPLPASLDCQQSLELACGRILHPLPPSSYGCLLCVCVCVQIPLFL